MSGALASVRDERGEVVSQEQLGGGMVEMTVRLPHIAGTALPGQFAQLRCAEAGGPLLRRPFSVAWAEADLASFVFAPTGVGTRQLARLQAGDEVQALGPLGTGFSLDTSADRRLCIAGGLGCAPFPLLLRALRDRGAQDVCVISGAATAARLYPADRYRRGDGGINVIELTVDGTAGRAGLVTEVIDGLSDAATGIYACGPNPMLAALWRALANGPPPRFAEASLEAPMGCGYGTCLGCALPVVSDAGAIAWALCCSQGPVMDMATVAWAELMALPPVHAA